MNYSPLFLISLFLPVTASAAQNTLLRSGPMTQFGDTKIYSSEGIEIQAGPFQGVYFSESKRLADALGAGSTGPEPAVGNDWQTSEEFEEWTDRLILRRTTSFTLLDGAKFHSQFFTGDPFSPHPNIVPDPATPPAILDLAADFIAADGHLNLYPAARDAGNISPQSLLDELSNDIGPVTFTEVIEFSRLVPMLNDPSEADGVMNAIIRTEPVAGIELPESLTNNRANFSSGFLPQNLGTQPKLNLVTSATYSQEMLNGFTIGKTWSKSITYDRSWMSFKTSAFATFGIGVRIPWEATVEVGPRRIEKTSPDKTAYDANISIQTLDADEDFYRRVGLPSEHYYDGQEAVLHAGAGIPSSSKSLAPPFSIATKTTLLSARPSTWVSTSIHLLERP